jgi:hypothetical protein
MLEMAPFHPGTWCLVWPRSNTCTHIQTRWGRQARYVPMYWQRGSLYLLGKQVASCLASRQAGSLLAKQVAACWPRRLQPAWQAALHPHTLAGGCQQMLGTCQQSTSGGYPPMNPGIHHFSPRFLDTQTRQRVPAQLRQAPAGRYQVPAEGLPGPSLLYVHEYMLNSFSLVLTCHPQMIFTCT